MQDRQMTNLDRDMPNGNSESGNIEKVTPQYPIPARLPRKNIGYRIFKRLFDFVSALCLSLIISPLLIVVALIIVVKDFGSPLYAQLRVGMYHRPLRVYKFRSMKKGADNLEKMLTKEQLEEYRREYKLRDDPRLIGYKKPGDGKRCFGAILRKLSIDELPQILINICILGNMSVVGPRPILKEELEANYTPEQQRLLLTIKPGLTGYWQAYARNDATYASGQRQKMEMYYVYHRSLWLDFKILMRTVISVFTKRGAR